MAENILENLREKGFRLTRVRKALIEIFETLKVPLSVPQLKILLQEQGLTPDKTTLYREISFLMEQNLVVGIELGEGKKRYESAQHGHHHHLVCLRCDNIEDIEVEADLKDEEKRILKLKGFEVQHHALEFFGLCKRCRNARKKANNL